MTETTTAEQGTGGHEVVLTRTFDAGREMVWRAWTDPKQVAQWWGPHEFTNPLCELDVRPGGALRIHMTGPDGTVYPTTGIYQEVVEYERLVFTDKAFEDESGGAALEGSTTVTFAERDGKTTVTVRAILTKVAPGMEEAADGMEEGWSQSLERLERHLRGT